MACIQFTTASGSEYELTINELGMTATRKGEIVRRLWDGLDWGFTVADTPCELRTPLQVGSRVVMRFPQEDPEFSSLRTTEVVSIAHL